MLPVTRRRAGTTPTSLALVGTSVIAVAYGFSRYGFGLFVPTFSDEFTLTAATAGAISSAGYASYLLSDQHRHHLRVADHRSTDLGTGTVHRCLALGVGAFSLAAAACAVAAALLIPTASRASPARRGPAQARAAEHSHSPGHAQGLRRPRPAHHLSAGSNAAVPGGC